MIAALQATASPSGLMTAIVRSSNIRPDQFIFIPGSPIMKKHQWREKTEDGQTRLVTATRHAGKWRLRSRLKSEDLWTDFPTIPLEDLESLHDIISRKYQRNRVPHEHILEIEALIAAAKRS